MSSFFRSGYTIFILHGIFKYIIKLKNTLPAGDVLPIIRNYGYLRPVRVAALYSYPGRINNEKADLFEIIYAYSSDNLFNRLFRQRFNSLS